MPTGFLRTKVGRRFLAVNLLTAFVPVAVLAVVAYVTVRAQLGSQADARMRRLARTVGVSTLSALTDLSLQVQALPITGRQRAAGLDTVITADASAGVPAALSVGTDLALDSTAQEHLATGLPLLRLVPRGGGMAVLEGRAVLPWTTASRPVRWARFSDGALFGENSEAVDGEEALYCLFDVATQRRISCSQDMPPEAEALARTLARTGLAGSGDIANRRAGHIVAVRDIFLRHQYSTADWRAVILQPEQASFAAIASFRTTVLLLGAAMLVLIFAVSHAQIRRTTDPLDRLRDGTQRLEAGDFLTPVQVKGDDEYAEVARSFNGMAGTLHRQISLMRTLDAVDQTALGTHDVGAVMSAALPALAQTVPCAQVSLAIARTTDTMVFDAVTLDVATGAERRCTFTLPETDRRQLLANPRDLLLHGAARARAFVTTATPAGASTAVLPLVSDGALLGIVTVALAGTDLPPAVLAEGRRIADRVAMALGNVHLVSRLDALSAGTVLAFARAIDANSPWTAGHSERVTRVAMEIGKTLALTPSELDTLERGGLLHDIGKIAVPPVILDKAGHLNDDEWQVMRRHPVVGCEILSPIPAFTDALPLVRSHHERVDGTGYPDRLHGEEIPYLARILAVADVFDALASDRPYRAGMTTAVACGIIQKGSGSHFDPGVVHALLDSVDEGRVSAGTPAAATVSLAAQVQRARDSVAQPA